MHLHVIQKMDTQNFRSL